MTGAPAIGPPRVTALCRVHPIPVMRRAHLCGPCRLRPAVRPYARMSIRVHRIGALMGGNARRRCSRLCHHSHPLGAQIGHARVRIVRRYCLRSLHSQGWSDPIVHVRRTCAPMAQSAHGQKCALIAHAPRRGLPARRMRGSLAGPSLAVSVTIATTELRG